MDEIRNIVLDEMLKYSRKSDGVTTSLVRIEEKMKTMQTKRKESQPPPTTSSLKKFPHISAGDIVKSDKVNSLLFWIRNNGS